MRFGFHISISGGFSRVVERALERGCETLQLFSRNPRGWKYRPLNLDDVNAFRSHVARAQIHPVFVHLPYLPNLASPHKELYARSTETLCEDLRRSEALGAPYLIAHVGHRGHLSEEAAFDRIAEAINDAFRKVPNEIRLLLENTAGQGTEVGHSFMQLGGILQRIERKERLGFCLDTSHAFQAGYNLASLEGLNEAVEEFQEFVGLEYLRLLHLNDSKSALGSRVDRHWHIGEGHIGIEGFRHIVNHEAISRLPGIMETPRTNAHEDLRNMKVIRELVGE
jgi:deoxyribonuclease-4